MAEAHDDEHIDVPDRAKKSKGPLIAAAVLLAIIQPLVLATIIIGIIAFETRKVRISRWVGSSIAVGTLGLITASFDPLLWASWIMAKPSLALLPSGIRTLATDNVATIATAQNHDIIFAALVAIPVGLLIVAGYAWWRKYELEQRGKMEGDEYSHRRPVGVVDRLIAKHNTQRLTTGSWSSNNPESVAIGVGKYGAIAAMDVDDTKKSTLIVGTSQSGKTRLANSLSDQVSLVTGGGNITLDFKGDPSMAARKAALAEELGVPFLHFQLSSKSGAHYKAPHPYAPEYPAHYDPLAKGNGSSKAAMLLNSVPREGDAAAYFRSASEIVKLAWDIAALTGVTARVHSDGTPLSGLEVLSVMLNTDTLLAEGRKVTTHRVKASNPSLTDGEASRRAQSIAARLADMEQELKRTNSVLSGAVGDVRNTVAGYINDSAAGAWLNTGQRSVTQIDILRAVLNNEVILFTLPAQDYPETAAMIGTMVLLDLSNAVATLRDHMELIGTDADTITGELPWNPMVLQIEEVGSIRSTAAADAMLGLMNKSADMEIRVILSSQSLVDLEAVDGTGVWKRQIMAQVGNLYCLQVSEASDDADVCAYSNKVVKQFPSENRQVENNRLRLGIGAAASTSVRANPQETTRIAPGIPKGLNRGQRELLWINTAKTDGCAIHTIRPEGPNQWWEVLTMVPVHEPEQHWNPFDDDHHVQQATHRRTEAFTALMERLRHDAVLHQLTRATPTVDIPEPVTTAASDEFLLNQLEDPENQPTEPTLQQIDSPEVLEDSPFSEDIFDDVAEQPQAFDADEEDDFSW